MEAKNEKIKKGGGGVLYFFKKNLTLFFYSTWFLILVFYNAVRGKKINIWFCFVDGQYKITNLKF